MKKTAVEWLFDNLNISGGSDDMKAFEQAKAMEKEQIKDAYYNGKYNSVSRDTAEQYYTETYEQN